MLWANVTAGLAHAATVFTALAVIAVAFSPLETDGSYKLGIDIDDTTTPVVTNVVDVRGMIVFIAVSSVVLGV